MPVSLACTIEGAHGILAFSILRLDHQPDYTDHQAGGMVLGHKRLGYLVTGDSLDRQVDHRIYRLIWVAVNFYLVIANLLVLISPQLYPECQNFYIGAKFQSPTVSMVQE